MKQQWSLWILPVLLALLMGCQQQPTAPLSDSNTIPAGTTSITEETSPQTRLADAANLTITEVDQTIFVSKQELVPYSSVISVQATRKVHGILAQRNRPTKRTVSILMHPWI